MADQDDGRVDELQLLAAIARSPRYEMHCPPGTTGSIAKQRDTALFLIQSGYANGMERMSWSYQNGVWENTSAVDDPVSLRYRQMRAETMNKLLGGQPIDLQLSHAGRVRMAQLRDDLQQNRLRDTFNILLDQRHVDRDLAIALTRAGQASPVAIATFDLNKFKPINDTHGHAAGDALLRVYLAGLDAIVGAGVDAYRCGGDEALLIVTGENATRINDLVKRVLLTLSGENVRFGEALLGAVHACCGVASSVDPGEAVKSLKQRADEQLYRAKAHSKLNGDKSCWASVSSEPSLIVVE